MIALLEMTLKTTAQKGQKNKNTHCLQQQTMYQQQQNYSKTCCKLPLKRRPRIGLKDRLLLNAGQKYYILLHAAF